MKKIKMSRGITLTFEEGCNKYLENCRQRNLKEGTINHYRQSYVQFYKLFDPKMPIEDIDERRFGRGDLFLQCTPLRVKPIKKTHHLRVLHGDVSFLFLDSDRAPYRINRSG